MRISKYFFYLIISSNLLFSNSSTQAQNSQSELIISSNWKLQDSAKVKAIGNEISKNNYFTKGWFAATVPGTVLTTLVNNKVYPEPLYGENNRPDKIPESLNKTSYWYRTSFLIPANYAGKKIWLNFEGINYAAKVWVNGKEVGTIKGAFARGIFNITPDVQAGHTVVIAVLISPQPNPGDPHEHTIANGMGKNGGVTAIDGPTFLSTIGWDWIPAIRDRNTGIWQKVFLSSTGSVIIKNSLVTSDVELPSLNTADVSIQTTVQNVSNTIQNVIVKGSFGNVNFKKSISLQPNTSTLFIFNKNDFPQLHINHPNLWWPNGLGKQNMYELHLNVEVNGAVSDNKIIPFGIRKITYAVADTGNLTLSVNGVKVFCKGGNWGMDEAMKRIPYARLEAEIKMHQIANYNMIRNWVGQSTGEDFYSLCDKYGIMIWDEFFQPNPNDGPNPTNIDLYINNVREKILRFRNHPSIAVWCARNEGYPPKIIDDSLQKVMAELEPNRLYQPSSNAGRGVHSGGPYWWRKPSEYYTFKEAFKTELGSVSIPTLESVHGMLDKKDWEIINDAWAEHDFAKGAQRGQNYPADINNRYGKVANLADFVRKGQLANYESFRAMYEGRNAKLFNPCTGVLTWMSNPAQPSFVWQLYHYDLEPNASLYATKKACEQIHIQLNEQDGRVQVINNLPKKLQDAKATLTIYNLDGAVYLKQNFPVNALSFQATDIDTVQFPSTLSSVYFIKLELRSNSGELISDNFYWKALPSHVDDLKDLNLLPTVKLDVIVMRADKEGKCLLNVTLHNSAKQVALMAHLQLRRQTSKERVLPVYYSDNYISLVPNETKTITIEAAQADLKGEKPMIFIDGWNIDVNPFSNTAVSVLLNKESQVSYWPVTGLPVIQMVKLKIEDFELKKYGD